MSLLILTYRAIFIGASGEEVVLGDADIATTSGNVVVLRSAAERRNLTEAREVGKDRRDSAVALASKRLEGRAARGKEDKSAGDLHDVSGDWLMSRSS